MMRAYLLADRFDIVARPVYHWRVRSRGHVDHAGPVAARRPRGPARDQAADVRRSCVSSATRSCRSSGDGSASSATCRSTSRRSRLSTTSTGTGWWRACASSSRMAPDRGVRAAAAAAAGRVAGRPGPTGRRRASGQLDRRTTPARCGCRSWMTGWWLSTCRSRLTRTATCPTAYGASARTSWCSTPGSSTSRWEATPSWSPGGRWCAVRRRPGCRLPSGPCCSPPAGRPGRRRGRAASRRPRPPRGSTAATRSMTTAGSSLGSTCGVGVRGPRNCGGPRRSTWRGARRGSVAQSGASLDPDGCPGPGGGPGLATRHRSGRGAG